ncbi:MAG: hypothetical protein AAF494_03565 [Pseudomonadota bacterium]
MSSRAFFRVAAIGSILSVASTLILIFAPRYYPAMDDFAARMELVNHLAYQLRAWTYLVHPFLVMTAASGLVAAVWQRERVLAILGLTGFGLWAATEAAQQCLTLFAYDRWRVQWLAGDPVILATMELRAAIYSSLWDAAYVLLIIGFFIGNLALAWAFWKGEGFDRIVAISLALAAILTLLIIVTEFGGPALLPAALAPLVYPAIQPAGRFVIGLWLWRHAARMATSAAASPSEQRL